MNVRPAAGGANFRSHIRCRICRSRRLAEFLNLGSHPLANSFLAKQALSRPEARYPLRVLWCEECNLSQLGEVVNPETLFRNYVYFSSAMPSSSYYRNYVEEVVRRFLLRPRDLVVEIGSNDGYLLGAIRKCGARVLGVDPAENIAALANDRGIETIPNFFNEGLAGDMKSRYGEAKLVIGNNVVAHIDDHHDLIRGVRSLLSPKGIFIFEAPYILDMFENLAFDSIYHEHLSYLAVRPLARLFSEYGLEIFDVKTTPIQGQSFRVYAAPSGAWPVQSSVADFIRREEELGLASIDAYRYLARRVESLKKEVVNLLCRLKQQGKRIAAYGAPARGNTLLNYFGIGSDVLEYATEELPSKIGLYAPGMHIPVVEIEEARKNPPDYYLLLAWPYQKVILEKEKEFRKKGGKFILPVGNMRFI